MKKELPDRIVWSGTGRRPKTKWLLHGFRELGIPVIETQEILQIFKPPGNVRGPYVYPMYFHFGEKRILVMFDIHTKPDFLEPNLLSKTRVYFKVHASKKVLQRPNVILFPNSASSLEYLDHLEDFRQIKADTTYALDFFFIGWNDDDGLRLWTVKKAKAQKAWRVVAGCMPFKHHTTVEPKFSMPRMGYLSYLSTHAASKINLALPGGRSLPFVSFRHVELLGIGAAVITRRPTSVPFRKDQFDHCVIYYDRENFIDVVNYYLQNEEERERIAMNARRYYEKFLTPERHAFCMINAIRKRI